MLRQSEWKLGKTIVYALLWTWDPLGASPTTVHTESRVE